MALAEKLPIPPTLASPPSEPLSSVDYAWLRMDEPANLMMISGVLVMATRVDLGRLREVFEGRLLPIPRFRQRVVVPAAGGHARWEADPAFDLDRHLSLPLGIADPVARLAELARRARALKRSAEPVVVYGIQPAGEGAASVQKLVVKIFGTKATAVMTNIPRPREVLYLRRLPHKGGTHAAGARRTGGPGGVARAGQHGKVPPLGD